MWGGLQCSVAFIKSQVLILLSNIHIPLHPNAAYVLLPTYFMQGLDSYYPARRVRASNAVPQRQSNPSKYRVLLQARYDMTEVYYKLQGPGPQNTKRFYFRRMSARKLEPRRMFKVTYSVVELRIARYICR